MDNGNLGINLLYVYAGNPTSVSVQAFNPPAGSLVLDTSTPALWQKTSVTDNSTFNLVIAGASTGTTTFPGPIVENTQSLSGAGAVNVTTGVTKLTTTGSSQALTMADGVNGQLKSIVHEVDGGSAILTPTTKTGFSTITFTAVGDSATLVFVTTRGWMILAVNGATVA